MTEAFNRDKFIWSEFVSLTERFNVDVIVETGTYKAQSTIEFDKLGLPVHTIERRKDFFDDAKVKLEEAEAKNVYIHLGDSPEVLDKRILPVIPNDKRIIFFLDAHWYDDNCLERELEVLSKHFHNRLKPIILIHDFKVPGKPEFGYDEYSGREYSWTWVRPYIDRIYGFRQHSHWYNTGLPNNGNPRGCVFIVPKEGK